MRFSHECGKKINEQSEFSEILENKEEFENVVIHCLKEDPGLNFIDDNFWKRPVGHCMGMSGGLAMQAC